jgi:hypothetical protein
MSDRYLDLAHGFRQPMVLPVVDGRGYDGGLARAQRALKSGSKRLGAGDVVGGKPERIPSNKMKRYRPKHAR